MTALQLQYRQLQNEQEKLAQNKMLELKKLDEIERSNRRNEDLRKVENISKTTVGLLGEGNKLLSTFTNASIGATKSVLDLLPTVKSTRTTKLSGILNL